MLVSDEEVVETAVDAAEAVVFERYSRSVITDLDITVRFDEGVLTVDVYLNVPDEEDTEAMASEAGLAAQRAVDELLGD